MKLDWHYITEDRADANIDIVSMDCIRTISNADIPDASKAERIAGILMLNEALHLSLEGNGDDE